MKFKTNNTIWKREPLTNRLLFNPLPHLDYVYTDHKRTVNKICFHPNEPNYLISGSQDGRMNLFDLRVKEKAMLTFLSQSESVRDVQFSRFRDNIFSSVQENGRYTVQALSFLIHQIHKAIHLIYTLFVPIWSSTTFDVHTNTGINECRQRSNLES